MRAVVLNDAGIGTAPARASPGSPGSSASAIAACAIDHRSARIADGADMLANGVVSHANEVAARARVPARAHLRARWRSACSRRMPTTRDATSPRSARRARASRNTGHREVWAIDSVALVRAEDRRAIVVTGSHGALLGGAADDGVLDVDVFAAFFNDAGGGKDDAGFSRLPVLDERGIAAATVSANTARIGDGRSTYETGVLSRVNDGRAAAGAARGHERARSGSAAGGTGRRGEVVESFSGRCA